MKKENDILKKIEIDKTKEDFTQKVMNNIYALENEKKIQKVLKEVSVLSVQDNFSDAVMKEISIISRKKKRRSILNLKEKSLFVFGSTILVLILVFSKSTENETIYNKFDLSILYSFKNNEFLPLFSIILFCISILLFIDYYVNIKKRIF